MKLRSIPLLAAWATMLMTLGACASYDKSHVDYGNVTTYKSTLTIDEITLAAEPYDTKAEVVGAFDENLIEEGYYPVRILLQNDSQYRLLVQRDSVELRSPSGQIFRPVGAAVMADDFEDDAMTYALLGFGFLSYTSAKDANKERELDYANKELPETRVIAPRSRLGAFVYFKLPDGTDVNSSTLRMAVERMDGGGPTEFELPLENYRS